MEDDLANQEYLSTVSLWEYYYTDPEHEPDASNWRTGIYWPVRKP
jgi:hypothetical protein